MPFKVETYIIPRQKPIYIEVLCKVPNILAWFGKKEISTLSISSFEIPVFADWTKFLSTIFLFVQVELDEDSEAGSNDDDDGSNSEENEEGNSYNDLD